MNNAPCPPQKARGIWNTCRGPGEHPTRIPGRFEAAATPSFVPWAIHTEGQKCKAALSECTKSDVGICSLIPPCSFKCFAVAATKKRMLKLRYKIRKSHSKRNGEGVGVLRGAYLSCLLSPLTPT